MSRAVQAYSAMQARLVSLLLRHDLQRFGDFIAARDSYAAAPAGPEMQFYRDLATLFVLRDELFEDILPRIVRRLSFAAPRTLLIEEPPVRGRIDWERSLAATWDETPGAPPLLLHTRQRRRDFATPENLLAVVTVLEYQAAAHGLLWDEQRSIGSAALRHPLNELIERSERELAFPQFAGLRAEAAALIASAEVHALEQAVSEQMLRGSNSAYADLLDWRQRLAQLSLLHREATFSEPSVGADPARDNYLYQLWIFYELADLLRDAEALEQIDLRSAQMALRFRWGACRYELRHDQTPPDQLPIWQTTPAQNAVPGVRPDFYLRRIDPPPVEVRHAERRYWREPGVVWDAKYYRERESPNAPALPVKRMIADLALLGERRGTLLFALLQGSEADPERAHGYQLGPSAHAELLAPDLQVRVEPLCPAMNPEQPQAILRRLLDQAHSELATPPLLACHGVFLDSLSLIEQGGLLARNGSALPTEDLLVCPKPHIGAWRIDLVSREQHCCRDGRVCQIAGLAGAAPPVRPPRSARELLHELERLLSQTDLADLDEDTVEFVSSRIEAVTRSFAQITGALQDLRRYEAKLGDLGLDRTLHLFAAPERESLALAIYLRDQLDEISANDFSAPLIHFARVVERELTRRLEALPGISRHDFKGGRITLGSLGGTKHSDRALWGRIEPLLRQRWQGNIDPDDPSFHLTIDQLIAELTQLVNVRNQAAHTTPIPRDRFRNLSRNLCSSGPLRFGLLNAIMLAWPHS